MKYLLVIIVALLYYSCKDIKFTEPQPKGIESLAVFPEELRGIYYDSKNNDTLRIQKNAFIFGNKASLIYSEGTISDTLVIKAWENNYFVNLYENNLWNLFIVNVLANKDLTIAVIDTEEAENIEKIKALIPLKEVYNNNNQIEYYVAQPSAEALKKIIALQSILEKVELKRISK